MVVKKIGTPSPKIITLYVISYSSSLYKLSTIVTAGRSSLFSNDSRRSIRLLVYEGFATCGQTNTPPSITSESKNYRTFTSDLFGNHPIICIPPPSHFCLPYQSIIRIHLCARSYIIQRRLSEISKSSTESTFKQNHLCPTYTLPGYQINFCMTLTTQNIFQSV